MTTTEIKEPYKDFFPNVSFIASILVSVSIGSAISLPSFSTFFGSADPKVLAQLQQSASFFAWGACVNGGSLVLSLLMQLLYTSPHFHAFATSDDYKRAIRWVVGTIGWLSILMGAGGMALVAEGLKIVERRAGLTLQWMLLGFCFPVLFFWIVFRVVVVPAVDKHRSKSKEKGGEGSKEGHGVDLEETRRIIH